MGKPEAILHHTKPMRKYSYRRGRRFPLCLYREQSLCPRGRWRNIENKRAGILFSWNILESSYTPGVTMAQTHKEAIRIPLALLAVIYAVFFAFVALDGNWQFLTGNWPSKLGSAIVLSSIGFLVVGLITSQLDAIGKARLIFWRWSQPLPGGEAFTRWIDHDERIDAAKIRTLHGPLPIDRKEQNRLWLRFFRDVEEHGSVVDANRQYLLFRDGALITLVLGLVFSVSLLLVGSSWKLKLLFVATMALLFLLMVRTARLSGIRLVKAVLILI